MRVPAFDTNLPGARDAQAQPVTLYRMKVAAIVSAISPSSGKILKCNRWDGTNTGVRTYMVEPVVTTHVVGDDIYAHVVNGKTASTYAGSGSGATRHVVWRESGGGGSAGLPQPRPLYSVLTVINSAGDVAFDAWRFI